MAYPVGCRRVTGKPQRAREGGSLSKGSARDGSVESVRGGGNRVGRKDEGVSSGDWRVSEFDLAFDRGRGCPPPPAAGAKTVVNSGPLGSTDMSCPSSILSKRKVCKTPLLADRVLDTGSLLCNPTTDSTKWLTRAASKYLEPVRPRSGFSPVRTVSRPGLFRPLRPSIGQPIKSLLHAVEYLLGQPTCISSSLLLSSRSNDVKEKKIQQMWRT